MRTPRVGVGVGRQERNSKQPSYGINNSRGAVKIENQPLGVADNKEVALGRVWYQREGTDSELPWFRFGTIFMTGERCAAYIVPVC
jgi:hypothetical protein